MSRILSLIVDELFKNGWNIYKTYVIISGKANERKSRSHESSATIVASIHRLIKKNFIQLPFAVAAKYLSATIARAESATIQLIY